MSELCFKPTLCPSALDKAATRCGHKVLYGPTACWRRDGRPDRCVGLQDSESPFAGEGEE